MKKELLAGLGLVTIALSACAQNGEANNAAASAPEADNAAQAGSEAENAAAAAPARAELRNAEGATVATGTATPAGDQLQIRLEATGLPAGTYAAHVHAVGRCDPPAFESAGPHWNPANRQHGSENPQGPHMGDLPNLTIGADGRGTLDYAIAGATPLLDADGAALVIHASADDYRTDPSGNSGARIACGAFQ